jgi:two-component system response regulator DesR
VVAALAAGDRIMPAAVRHHPDVVLLDIDLTVAAELAGRLPRCGALILTGLGTPDNLRRALAAGCPDSCSKRADGGTDRCGPHRGARGRVIDPRLGYPAVGSGDDPPAATLPAPTVMMARLTRRQRDLNDEGVFPGY